MLGLQHDTDLCWVEAAERDLDRLLIDHAHCELKAAQSALSLLGRVGFMESESADQASIGMRSFGRHENEPASPKEASLRQIGAIDALTALAKEELEHFEAVQIRLANRGVELGAPSVDQYVRELQAAARRDHRDHPALLDRMLVCALIEARSCERFHRLAEGLGSTDLREFYRELMASEARHYRLFRDLAEAFFGRAAARSRLEELCRREAEVARGLPLGPTVHG